MTKQYFVGCTKNGQETLAQRELRNQGFETYLPLYVSEWARKPRIRAFLTSYIFIRLDPVCERWRSIFSTFGMRTVLHANDKPQPVPDYIIEEIKAREVNGLVQLPPPIQCKFKPGDAVRIKGSPVDLLFSEALDHKRAAVFLTMLGRGDLRTVVPLNRLTAASVAAVA